MGFWHDVSTAVTNGANAAGDAAGQLVTTVTNGANNASHTADDAAKDAANATGTVVHHVGEGIVAGAGAVIDAASASAHIAFGIAKFEAAHAGHLAGDAIELAKGAAGIGISLAGYQLHAAEHDAAQIHDQLTALDGAVGSVVAALKSIEDSEGTEQDRARDGSRTADGIMSNLSKAADSLHDLNKAITTLGSGDDGKSGGNSDHHASDSSDNAHAPAGFVVLDSFQAHAIEAPVIHTDHFAFHW